VDESYSVEVEGMHREVEEVVVVAVPLRTCSMKREVVEEEDALLSFLFDFSKKHR
jgi:hypothetical protein